MDINSKNVAAESLVEVLENIIEAQFNEVDITDRCGDAVDEAMKNYDLDDKISSALDNYNFEDEISKAISDFDFETDIERALEHKDLVTEEQLKEEIGIVTEENNTLNLKINQLYIQLDEQKRVHNFIVKEIQARLDELENRKNYVHRAALWCWEHFKKLV